MSVCQRTLADAQQIANRYGLTIRADGTVSPYDDGNLFERALEETISQIEGRNDSAQVAQVQELVTYALRRATQADEEAAAELRKIASHAGQADPNQAYGDNTYSNGDGLVASRLELQMIYQSIPTGPPSLVSKWWAGLSSGQKATLMQAAPGVIGTLVGIPAIVRAHLRGSTGINRVALVNYALDNTFNGAGDVHGEDNCTNFVSNGLEAAGLRQEGNFMQDKVLNTDSNTNDNWYKQSEPGIPAGSSRSHSWGGAQDLHQFLVNNGSREVSYSQAQPGDVAFWKDNKGVYHSAVVTAKINGKIFYTQHTPGEQNASWGSRQSMPDYTNPNDPTHVTIVQVAQDKAAVPHPQSAPPPDTPVSRPSPPERPHPDPQPN